MRSASNYAVAVAIVTGMGLVSTISCRDPLTPPSELQPQFELISGSSPCPQDAPDCEQADSTQLAEALERANAELNPDGGVWCQTAYNLVMNAIQAKDIDTFTDYTRNGWHVLGSYNSTTGRMSFNRSFFGGGSCNLGWCSQHRFGQILAHEGGHAVNPGASESSVQEYFESNCVWN